MASHVKTKLKQAREAIGQKNYAKARDLSLGILELDQNNYNAYVTAVLCVSCYLELWPFSQECLSGGCVLEFQRICTKRASKCSFEKPP